MAGFSQFHNFDKMYQQYIVDFLFSPEEYQILPTFPFYSNGYPEWSDKSNTGKLNPLHENDGPHFIQGEGRSNGQLFGGCIEVLEMLKGTDFWPNKEFWAHKILFLETSEDKPSIDYVKYWLRNYGVMIEFEIDMESETISQTESAFRNGI